MDKINFNKVSIKTRNYKDGVLKVISVPVKRVISKTEAEEIREEMIKREMLPPEDSNKSISTAEPVKGNFYIS